MFCYQCQETAKNEGCTIAGVCGKKADTANLQDLLIYVLRGISIYCEKAKELGKLENKVGLFIAQSLFSTITNANFDDERFVAQIKEGLKIRDELKEKYGDKIEGELHDSAVWFSDDIDEFHKKAAKVGVLSQKNEDVRSLRELLIIGVKGLSAYADHAAILGFEDEKIYAFIMEALVSTTKDLSVDEMVAMVMKCGEYAVNTMALLDKQIQELMGILKSQK